MKGQLRTFWDVFRHSPPKDWLSFDKLKLFTKVWPNTMVSYERLSNAYDLAKKIDEDNIPGDIVECGVWKGGCSGVMASQAQNGRKSWLFDSFEGLPEPTDKDGKEAAALASEKTSGKLGAISECVGPIEDVRDLLFLKLNLNEDNIHIVKGWFQNTLPTTKEKIGDIAILRLDGDWYDSTKVCLEHLYDSVVKDGYIIIDDYGHWEGCKKAVDEFFEERGIELDLKSVDYTEHYFQKK